MKYTPAKVRNASADFSNMLCIPHQLLGFINTSTELVRIEGGREAFVFHTERYVRCGERTGANHPLLLDLCQASATVFFTCSAASAALFRAVLTLSRPSSFPLKL